MKLAKVFILTFLFAVNITAEVLDIRILRVEFKYEEPDNSLTTGRGEFADSTVSEEYWKSQIEYAKNYFSFAGNKKVQINAEVYPKKKDAFKLEKTIIDYNRTSRRKGEPLAEFEDAVAKDYADFVKDVLAKAKSEEPEALAPANGAKRVILIAHAGANRFTDGGTLGAKGMNTPGDFMDSHIDSTWGDFFKGFEVSAGDSIKSAIVTSETASQDDLNWGIAGSITSQIGRELGLPYSFDVKKGFSRLGYFDGMDFAGYNAGNGYFPSIPSAWMRIYKGWDSNVKTVTPKRNVKDTVEICAAGYDGCAGTPQIIKIPISSNEYILLENRIRTHRDDGKVSVKLKDEAAKDFELDSIFNIKGVVENIDWLDAALPASGIVAWHVNQWYIDESIDSGTVNNSWKGKDYGDHRFGIALIEAGGILGLGKEFKAMSGESAFYFGSGADVIPNNKTSSISPSGYANTTSTFGGKSGIKITAIKPADAKEEHTMNPLTGDSITTWRALKMKIEIEQTGSLIKQIPKDEWDYEPKDEDFNNHPLFADINSDGFEEDIYLDTNKLKVVDKNKVPIKNFPVLLSKGEPFTDLTAKPLAIDINGDDTLEILVPTNTGLLLAVDSKGKLVRDEFPVAAGSFVAGNPVPMYIYKHNTNTIYTKHRDEVKAFHLPKAIEVSQKAENLIYAEEFFIFPNPVKNGKATARFRIYEPAATAKIQVFDITGKKVKEISVDKVDDGSNQIPLDLSNLGSDVYSVRLICGKKTKWFRIGMIR